MKLSQFLDDGLPGWNEGLTEGQAQDFQLKAKEQLKSGAVAKAMADQGIDADTADDETIRKATVQHLNHLYDETFKTSTNLQPMTDSDAGVLKPLAQKMHDTIVETGFSGEALDEEKIATEVGAKFKGYGKTALQGMKQNRFANADFASEVQSKVSDWAKVQLERGADPEFVAGQVSNLMQKYQGGLNEMENRKAEMAMFDVDNANGEGSSGASKTLAKTFFPNLMSQVPNQNADDVTAKDVAVNTVNAGMDLLTISPRAVLAATSLAVRGATGSKRGWSLAEAMMPGQNQYGVQQIEDILVDQYGVERKTLRDPTMKEALMGIVTSLQEDTTGTLATLAAESYRDAAGRLITGKFLKGIVTLPKKLWLLNTARRLARTANATSKALPLLKADARILMQEFSMAKKLGVVESGAARTALEAAKASGKKGAGAYLAHYGKEYVGEFAEEGVQGGFVAGVQDAYSDKTVGERIKKFGKDALYEAVEAIPVIPFMSGGAHGLEAMRNRLEMRGVKAPAFNMEEPRQAAEQAKTLLDEHKDKFDEPEREHIQEAVKQMELFADLDEAVKADDADGVVAAHAEMLAHHQENVEQIGDAILTKAIVDGPTKNHTFDDGLKDGLPGARDQVLDADRFTESGVREIASGAKGGYEQFGFPVEMTPEQEKSFLKMTGREDGLRVPKKGNFKRNVYVTQSDSGAIEALGDPLLKSTYLQAADAQLRQLAVARYELKNNRVNRMPNTAAIQQHRAKVEQGADMFDPSLPVQEGRDNLSELRAKIISQDKLQPTNQLLEKNLEAGQLAYVSAKAALGPVAAKHAYGENGELKKPDHGATYFLPFSNRNEAIYRPDFVEEKARAFGRASMGLAPESDLTPHPGMSGNDFDMRNVRKEVGNVAQYAAKVGSKNASEMVAKVSENAQVISALHERMSLAYANLKTNPSKANAGAVIELQKQWGLAMATFEYEKNLLIGQADADAAAALPEPAEQEQTETDPQADLDELVGTLRNVAAHSVDGSFSSGSLQLVVKANPVNGNEFDLTTIYPDGNFATYSVNDNGYTRVAESEGFSDSLLAQYKPGDAIEPTGKPGVAPGKKSSKRAPTGLEKVSESVTPAAIAVAEVTGKDPEPRPVIDLDVKAATKAIASSQTPGAKAFAERVADPKMQPVVQDFMSRIWFNEEVKPGERFVAAQRFLRQMLDLEFSGKRSATETFDSKLGRLTLELSALASDPMKAEKSFALLAENPGYLFQDPKTGAVLPVNGDEARYSRHAHEARELSMGLASPSNYNGAMVNEAIQLSMDGYVTNAMVDQMVLESPGKLTMLQLPGVTNMYGKSWARMQGSFPKNERTWVRFVLPASVNGEELHEVLLVDKENLRAWMTKPTANRPEYTPDFIGTIHTKALNPEDRVSRSMRTKAEAQGWRTKKDVGELAGHIFGGDAFPGEEKISTDDLKNGDQVTVNDNGTQRQFTVKPTLVGGIPFKTIVNNDNPNAAITFSVHDGKVMNVTSKRMASIEDKVQESASPMEKEMASEEVRRIEDNQNRIEAQKLEETIKSAEAEMQQVSEQREQLAAKNPPLEGETAPRLDIDPLDRKLAELTSLISAAKEAQNRHLTAIAESKNKMVMMRNEESARSFFDEADPAQDAHYPAGDRKHWTRLNQLECHMNDAGVKVFNRISNAIYAQLENPVGKTKGRYALSVLALNDTIGDGKDNLGIGQHTKSVDVVSAIDDGNRTTEFGTKQKGIRRSVRGIPPHLVNGKGYDLVTFVSEIEPGLRTVTDRYYAADPSERNYRWEESVALSRSSKSVKNGGIVQAVISPKSLEEKEMLKVLEEMQKSGSFLSMARVKDIRRASDVDRKFAKEETGADRNPATDGIVIVWQRNHNDEANAASEVVKMHVQKAMNQSNALAPQVYEQQIASAEKTLSSLNPARSTLSDNEAFVKDGGQLTFSSYASKNDHDLRPQGGAEFKVGAIDAVAEMKEVAKRTAQMARRLFHSAARSPLGEVKGNRVSPIVQIHVDTPHQNAVYDQGTSWPVGYGVTSMGTVDPAIRFYDAQTGKQVTAKGKIQEAVDSIVEAAASIPDGSEGNAFTTSYDPSRVPIIHTDENGKVRVTIGRPFVSSDFGADVAKHVKLLQRNVKVTRLDNLLPKQAEEELKRFKEEAANSTVPLLLVTGNSSGFVELGNYRGGTRIKMGSSALDKHSISIIVKNGKTKRSQVDSLQRLASHVQQATEMMHAGDGKFQQLDSMQEMISSQLERHVTAIAESPVNVGWLKELRDLSTPQHVATAMLDVRRSSLAKRIEETQYVIDRMAEMRDGVEKRLARALVAANAPKADGSGNYDTGFFGRTVQEVHQALASEAPIVNEWAGLEGMDKHMNAWAKADDKVKQAEQLLGSITGLASTIKEAEQAKRFFEVAFTNANKNTETLVSKTVALAVEKMASALDFYVDPESRFDRYAEDPIGKMENQVASIRNSKGKWSPAQAAARDGFVSDWDKAAKLADAEIDRISKDHGMNRDAVQKLIRQFANQSIAEQLDGRSLPSAYRATEVAVRVLEAELYAYTQEANGLLASEDTYHMLSPYTFMERLEVVKRRRGGGTTPTSGGGYREAHEDILDERAMMPDSGPVVRDQRGKIESNDYAGADPQDAKRQELLPAGITGDIHDLNNQRMALGDQIEEVREAIRSGKDGVKATRKQKFKLQNLIQQRDQLTAAINERIVGLDGQVQEDMEDRIDEANVRHALDIRLMSRFDGPVGAVEKLGNLFKKRFVDGEVEALEDMENYGSPNRKIDELRAESEAARVRADQLNDIALQAEQELRDKDPLTTLEYAQELRRGANEALVLVMDIDAQIAELAGASANGQRGSIGFKTMAVTGGMLGLGALIARGMLAKDDDKDQGEKLLVGKFAMAALAIGCLGAAHRARISKMRHDRGVWYIPKSMDLLDRAISFKFGQFGDRVARAETGAGFRPELQDRIEHRNGRKDWFEAKTIRGLKNILSNCNTAALAEFSKLASGRMDPSRATYDAAKSAHKEFLASEQALAGIEVAMGMTRDENMVPPSPNRLDPELAFNSLKKNIHRYLEPMDVRGFKVNTVQDRARALAYEIGGMNISTSKKKDALRIISDAVALEGNEKLQFLDVLRSEVDQAEDRQTKFGMVIKSKYPPIDWDAGVFIDDPMNVVAQLSNRVNAIANYEAFGGDEMPWLRDRLEKIREGLGQGDAELSNIVEVISSEIGQSLRGIPGYDGVRTVGKYNADRNVASGVVNKIVTAQAMTKVMINPIVGMFTNPTQSVISTIGRTGDPISNVKALRDMAKMMVSPKDFAEVKNLVSQMTDDVMQGEQFSVFGKGLDQIVGHNVIRAIYKNWKSEQGISRVAPWVKGDGVAAAASGVATTPLFVPWELYKAANYQAFMFSYLSAMHSANGVVKRLEGGRENSAENNMMLNTFGSQEAVDAIVARGEMTGAEKELYAMRFAQKANGTGSGSLDKPGLFSSHPALRLLGVFGSVPARLNNDILRYTVAPALEHGLGNPAGNAAWARLAMYAAAAGVGATAWEAVMRMLGMRDDKDERAATEINSSDIWMDKHAPALRTFFHVVNSASQLGTLTSIGNYASQAQDIAEIDATKYALGLVSGPMGSTISSVVEAGVNANSDEYSAGDVAKEFLKSEMPIFNQAHKLANYGLTDIPGKQVMEVPTPIDAEHPTQETSFGIGSKFSQIMENPVPAMNFRKPAWKPYGSANGVVTNKDRYQVANEGAKARVNSEIGSKVDQTKIARINELINQNVPEDVAERIVYEFDPRQARLFREAKKERIHMWKNFILNAGDQNSAMRQ